jgi:predicted AlkP superfamily pyrophosphatase or phosphodiesterase
MLKRWLALAVTLFLVGAPLAAQDPEPKKGQHGRLLLISLDALRPEAYLEERFGMTNLRALAARGVQAKKCVGVFPTLTYPSHTSIVTGTRPAVHGVVSNWIFDPRDGGKRWYFEEAHMHATPLWTAAKRAGLTTCVVHWPVTVGSTQIDWHVPEINVKGEDDLEAMRKNATPGLMEEVWPKDPGKDEPGIDAASTAAVCAIIEKHAPELLVLHLLQADGAQHHAGREDPEVLAAFARLDGCLGAILRSLEKAGVLDQTNIIVTGDHGMIDVHTAVKPNALLRELGFLRADEKGKFLDWTACANTGGASAAIYARDPADKATSERVVQAFKSAAASRYRGIFNVLDRDALDREEAFPGAICAIEGEPGYCMETDPLGGVLGVAHVRGNHGYMPDRDEVATGLVAAGPGIAKARTIPGFRMIDVAPLAAHLMGISLGPGVEGVLIPGILAPARKERVDDH